MITIKNCNNIDSAEISLEKEKLKLTIKELKTPAEAQNAPSLYSVFNLIYNGFRIN